MSYMDGTKRQAMRNAYRVVTKLKKSTDTITRADLIEALRRPLPPGEFESDATIRSAYRHIILNAGVRDGHRVVTYAAAAALAGKSIEAIWQAAYRKRLTKLTEHRNGRERVGVTFISLANWCRWTPEQIAEAARQLDAIREAHE